MIGEFRKEELEECQIYNFPAGLENSQSRNQRKMLKEDRKERIFYIALGVLFTITFLLLAFIVKYKIYIHTLQDENNLVYRKESEYISSLITKSDCRICGNNMLLSHWGEQNIGLINLNSFEYFIYEINRYDNNKNLIQEKVRFNYRTGYQKWTGVGGSNVRYSYDVNRGYFTGRISIDENTPLQVDKLKSYVCSDCLNSIVDQLYYDEPYCDIAFIDLNSKEIKIFTRNGLDLQLSDYQIVYHYDKEDNTFDFNGFYCPVRYTELGFGYNNSTVLGIISEYCTAYHIPLEVDDKLNKYIAELLDIYSIQHVSDGVVFEALGTEGYIRIYVYNDGTYEVN